MEKGKYNILNFKLYYIIQGILMVEKKKKKRNWNDAPTGVGMIVFGAIILLAALNELLG